MKDALGHGSAAHQSGVDRSVPTLPPGYNSPAQRRARLVSIAQWFHDGEVGEENRRTTYVLKSKKSGRENANNFLAAKGRRSEADYGDSPRREARSLK